MSNEIVPSGDAAKERQNSRKRPRQAEAKSNGLTAPVEPGVNPAEAGPNRPIAAADGAADPSETKADGPAATVTYAFNPPEERPAVEYAFEHEFDEEAYLRQHPEVAEAIAEGHLPNALFHFRVFSTKPRPAGEIVQRAPSPRQNGAEPGPGTQNVPPNARSAAGEPGPARDAVAVPKSLGPGSVDAVVASPSGAMFVIGWAAHREAPLHRVAVQFEDGRSREWPATNLIRFRRPDAEKALGLGPTRGIGFCGLLLSDGKANGEPAKPRAVTLGAADGASTEFPVTPRLVGEVELRELMLGYLSSAEFMGNKEVEAFFRLDAYLGDALIRHSRTITRAILTGATVERFETAADHFKGSVIVCLYGKGEFQFVQNALFAAGAGADAYEYIYVSNSPELIEMLCKTARISQRAYGLNVSIVMLPGNAGFGAANNIAAQHARSRRLLIVNPDVFPMNDAWAAQHNEAVEQLPAEQTRLFGPRLFYADGSLMHAGMYVDVDWGVSVADFEVRKRPMLRVEHYGKGAPRDAAAFRGPRPVSAISGAFMSMERGWFERIGGFAEDYIFAYYEDADLCLRSWDHGAPAWVHELDFWHLEGKGSSTLLPHHKGAALVNRWLFTREWHDRLAPEMLGRVRPSTPAKLRAAS